MKLTQDAYFRTEDFSPMIEDVGFTRFTFTVPTDIVCYGDYRDDLQHPTEPAEERLLLGLMLYLTRHNGHRVTKLLLERLFEGMNAWGEFDDKDAEELRQFVDAGIREYHVHGPFDAKSYETHRAEYLASKVGASEPSFAEKAA